MGLLDHGRGFDDGFGCAYCILDGGLTSATLNPLLFVELCLTVLFRFTAVGVISAYPDHHIPSKLTKPPDSLLDFKFSSWSLASSPPPVLPFAFLPTK